MLDFTSFGGAQRERIMKDITPGSIPGPEGALNHSLLYLACGHDSATGKLGVTPLLTISAPAERVAQGIVRERRGASQ